MSKQKPYLVITRPEPGLSETAEKVNQLGWRPLLMPVMMIQALPIGFVKTNNIQAIIFTSRQAVSPMVQQLITQKIAYQQIPVFTVGDITAQDAKEAGFINVVSADKDAVALAVLITDTLHHHKGRLLFPSAKGQGQLLMALLKQSGFSIVHYEAYQAQPVNKLSDIFLQALEAEKINSILFFSSETARFFIELLPDNTHQYLNSIQAIGISIKTKKILDYVSWRSVDVAAHPKTEEMLCLIKEHF